MKIMYPNYNRSIVNLIASIKKYYNIPYSIQTLPELDRVLEKEYNNMVLVLLDGLGSNVIYKTIGCDSFLFKHKISDLTSVFPPTTTTATASYLSGKLPIEHCWLGWHMYFQQIKKDIVLFNNKGYYDENYFNDKIVNCISYRSIFDDLSESGISCYSIKPPIMNNLERDLKIELNMVEEIIRSDDNKKFIYVYNYNPDHIMHEFGVQSCESIDMIKYMEKQLVLFYNRIDNDTIVIVCADHGLIDIEEINLFNYPKLLSMLERLPSLEPRASSFSVKKEKEKDFVNEFNNLFKDKFILLSKEEVYASSLFGDAKKHYLFDDFLGDYLAIACDKYMLIYSEDKNRIPMKAGHSGLLEDEMLIPLIILEKK